MSKSLLTEKNLERLNNLKSDITFKDGNDTIEIKYNKRMPGFYEANYTIKKNNSLVFEKTKGVTEYNFSTPNIEKFYISIATINNLIKENKTVIDYRGTNYIIFSENYINYNNYDFFLDDELFEGYKGLYYNPKSDEIGLLIREEFNKIEVDKSNEDIKIQINNIINKYNKNAKKTHDKVLNIIHEEEINKSYLSKNSSKLYDFNLILKQALYANYTKYEISEIINLISIIKEAYQKLIEFKNEKKNIQNEINELNSLLDRCFEWQEQVENSNKNQKENSKKYVKEIK